MMDTFFRAGLLLAVVAATGAAILSPSVEAGGLCVLLWVITVAVFAFGERLASLTLKGFGQEASVVTHKPTGTPPVGVVNQVKGDAGGVSPCDYVILGELLWYLKSPPSRAPWSSVDSVISRLWTQLATCELPIAARVADQLKGKPISVFERSNELHPDGAQQLCVMADAIREAAMQELKEKQ